MESNGKKLRELFQREPLVVAPGAYDAFSATLIENAGFEAVYMSGAALTLSLLGRPDIGYLSQTEMINSVRNIASAISVPLIADGDNGYGGPIQVMRTIEYYIKAGAAAIQMEDQIFPKRCGFMQGKQLVSKEDAIAKIKAACYVREKFDPDFVIIARTDAIAVNGIEDALDRANAYRQAGADVVYIEAPPSREIMERIGKELDCAWRMTIYAEGCHTPLLSNDELTALGFKLVIHPATLPCTVAKAMQEALRRFKLKGTPEDCEDMVLSFDDINALVRLNEIRALEQTFYQ